MKAHALTAALLFMSSTAIAGSMEMWIDEVLPTSYPKLVHTIKVNGPVTAQWSAQSGELNTAVVRITDGTLIISTRAPTSSATGDAWVDVELVDTNLDSHPDTALYSVHGDLKLKSPPLDDASKFIWYSSLAMIFRQTGCCR